MIRYGRLASGDTYEISWQFSPPEQKVNEYFMVHGFPVLLGRFFVKAMRLLGNKIASV